MSAAAIERWAENLVACGLLAPEDLAAAAKVAAEKGLPLQDCVVALGTLSEDQVCAAIADALGVPLVFPYAGGIDLGLLARFPLPLLRRLEAVPLHEEDGRIVVALARPADEGALRELARAAGTPIQAVMAAPRRLHLVLDDLAARTRAPEPLPDLAAHRTRTDPTAIALLFGRIERAIAAGASELRFDPLGGAIAVRVRAGRGGPLEEVAREPLERLTALVARARILAGEPGTPAEAAPGGASMRRRLRTAVGARPIDLDISVLPTRGGESVRIGLRRPPPVPAGAGDLGLEPALLARVEAAIAAMRGLILVAGSEYAAAAAAYAIGRSAGPAGRAVLALERSPLATEPRFLQVEVRPGVPIEDYLGSCLAQAPDVLYVGDPVEGEALAMLASAAHRRLVLCRLDPTRPEPALSGIGLEPIFIRVAEEA